MKLKPLNYLPKSPLHRILPNGDTNRNMQGTIYEISGAIAFLHGNRSLRNLDFV